MYQHPGVYIEHVPSGALSIQVDSPVTLTASNDPPPSAVVTASLKKASIWTEENSTERR